MTEFKHTPDSLADKLDQALRAGDQTVHHEDDPLVEAALRLANAPRPRLGDEAKARIHDQMLRQARQQRIIRRPDFSPLLRWGLVASVVIVVLLVPAAQVTLASVPGDVLYPVKLTIEQIEDTLASTSAARAALSLTHAERRTREAEILLERGQFDARLIRSAYDNLAQTASIQRSDPGLEPDLRLTLESRIAALVSEIDDLLRKPNQPDQPSIPPLMTELAVTRDSGALLLPQAPTDTPTSTATFTSTPTSTATWTATASETSTFTPMPEATETPAATPTATLPVNMIIEGPIQAIDGNTVTIYGIHVAFAPDDPILKVLQVGDTIRVNGSIVDAPENSVNVTNVETEITDDSIAISEDGQSAWRDNGNCSNPPPAWAPAKGWRARCEGQPQPGNSAGEPSDAANNNQPPGLSNQPDNANSGNSGNHGNSSGNQNGNGQSKDKDKDNDDD